MEMLETAFRNALADMLGAIGIASAGLGVALTIGLWAWYLLDSHKRNPPVPVHPRKKRTH